ncbi:MAG: transposase [Kosmotoga sp.]|nr:MAG: transposase [Kosmotoga sp.]
MVDTVKKSNNRELTTFARGIERDIEAVKNAIITEFSNGVIEGVINKIKVIKRIMYGRCSFELLKLKVIMS